MKNCLLLNSEEAAYLNSKELAMIRHLRLEALDCTKGQKAEAEFPFCPHSFDRAVMNAGITICNNTVTISTLAQHMQIKL